MKITILKSPITRKFSTWVEMEYDAKLVFKGVTWYRVKGGFGQRGDREDWVGNLPGVSLSVCDYMWMKSKRWGFDVYPSFEKALEGQMRKALTWSRRKLIEVRMESAKQIITLTNSMLLLEHHLAKPKRKKKGR